MSARFVNNKHEITQQYPLNPNGSPLGMTALTTTTGRVTSAPSPNPYKQPSRQPHVLAGRVGNHARALGGALLPLHAQFFPDKDIFLKQDTLV